MTTNLPPRDLPTPESFDGFRLLRPLGQGSMGRVYLAHDTVLDRQVAIKLLASVAPDAAARERFLREARAIARLQHPNVVTIYRVGEVGGQPYLVSELVAGHSLDKEPLPLPWPRALAIGLGLARGLAAAHGSGVLHRDLKPANAMLAADGTVKLLDFGLAKLTGQASSSGRRGPADLPDTADQGLTSPGALVGTPLYMAPEVWCEEGATPRSDVYSLGVVLYQLLAGSLPFQGQSVHHLALLVTTGPPPPLRQRAPRTPEALSRVVERCLQRAPAQRYASGQELAEALEQVSRASGRRWRLGALMAVAVLAGGALALPALRPDLRFSAAEAASRRGVAVLRFVDRGPGAAPWLAVAISEQLAAELGASARVRLLPGDRVAQMQRELALPAAASYDRETLARVRRNLGAELLVLGEYERAADGVLRVRARLLDAAGGDEVAASEQRGGPEALPALLSRIGEELRRALGSAALTPAEAAQLLALRPASPTAAQRYAEGLLRLRQLDLRGAREALEQAVQAEPAFPLSHLALAETWAALGQDGPAREQAAQALASAGGLPREQRLLIEARLQRGQGEIGRAIEIYRALLTFYPDNLEYGLQLAEAQGGAGQHREAVATLDGLRRLPPPLRDDPRIDLTLAQVSSLVSDRQTMEAAIQRVIEKGRERDASLLVAQARKLGAYAALYAGEYQRAQEQAQVAQAAFQAAGDWLEVADTLGTVAAARQRLGDFPGAQQRRQEAVELLRRIGHTSNLSIECFNQALLLTHQGQLTLADAATTEALDLARQVQLQGIIASSLTLRGWLWSLRGDFRRAGEELAAAWQVAEASKDQMFQAWVREREGEIRLWQGDLGGARARQEEALRLRRGAGYAGYAAESEVHLAAVALAQGRAGEAAALARGAAAYFERTQDADNLAWAQGVLVQATLTQGDLAAAAALAAVVERRRQASGHLLMRLAVLPALVQTWARRPEQAATARAVATAGLAEAREAGLPGAQFALRLALLEIGPAQGAGADHAARAALAREAAAAGYGLVARRAAAR